MAVSVARVVHPTRWRILLAGPLVGEGEEAQAPPVIPSLTLVRSSDAGFDASEARVGDRLAGPGDGAAERLERGDELWAWRANGELVSWCWVTHRGRRLGRARLSEVSGRVVLFDFHFASAWRDRGVLARLLRELRRRLPEDGAAELVAAVEESDDRTLAALADSGFVPVARTHGVRLLDRFEYTPVRATREGLGAPPGGLFDTWAVVEREGPHPVDRACADARSAGLRVDLIDDERTWAGLEREWEELFTQAANPAPPLAWSWLRLWWTRYADRCAAGPDALRILTVRREGRLIGALPLYLRRPHPSLAPLRELSFLSTGEPEHEETCADYLDLLHLPGDSEAAAEVLFDALLVERRVAFDRLTFDELSVRSPLLAWVDRARPRARAAAQAQITVLRCNKGSCPAADLRGGIDSWLHRLPSRRRTQPHRLLREAEEAHARLTVAHTRAEAHLLFEELVRLHQRRWTSHGARGAFASERFTGLHRELAERHVSDGRAVLARLSVAEQTLGVVYGFVTRERFDFYQAGVIRDESSPLRSPGITAHLLLMRHLAEERGVITYDFLRGASGYKQRMATDDQPMVGLRFEWDGPRGRAATAVDEIADVGGATCRLLGNAVARGRHPR